MVFDLPKTYNGRPPINERPRGQLIVFNLKDRTACAAKHQLLDHIVRLQGSQLLYMPPS
jgi:hypothetical protein